MRYLSAWLPSRDTWSSGIVSSSDSEGESSSEELVEEAGPWWVQFFAWAMCGTDLECCASMCGVTGTSLSAPAPKEPSLDLDSLPSSGLVFVVMRMEPLAVAFASACMLPGKFRGEHEIRVCRSNATPTDVQWQNFYVGWLEFIRRCLFSVVLLIASLVVWFLLYAPFFQLSVTVVSFNFESMLSMSMESLTGLAIAGGNCFMAVMVSLLVDYIGFRYAGRRLTTQLALLIPCVGVNCIMDFFVTVYASMQQMSPHMAHSTKTSMIQESLISLLFPSYVLVPYIAEPMAMIAGTLFVAIWRIKRDARITARQAEKAMVACQTDIANPMADMICTTTTILVTFLLQPSVHHRVLFPLIIVFCAVMYVLYRTRVLRWESFYWHGSNSMHSCEAFYWAIPLGVLAAAMERQWKNTPDFSDFTGIKWFLTHCFFHFAFLLFVVPVMEPAVPTTNISYAHALMKCPADYLNTNPIEVLKRDREAKSSQEGRLIYYRLDKEHLQDRAAKFHSSDEDGEDAFKSLIQVAANI